MKLLFLMGLGLMLRVVTMENTDSLQLLTKRLDRLTLDFHRLESRLEIKIQSLFDELKSAITSRQAPPEDITRELEITQNMKTVIEESVQKQSAIVFKTLSNEKWQIRKLKSDIQADIKQFKAQTDDKFKVTNESINTSLQLNEKVQTKTDEFKHELNRKIAKLKANMQDHNDTLKNVHETLTSNEVKITQIAAETAHSISSIFGRISTNTNNISSISSRLSSSASDISEISSKLSLNTNSISTQSSRISELYAKRYFSAFHAWLTQGKDYSRDQTVVFNGVVTNDGDDYDPSTGVYTAPVNGTYIISFSVGCREAKSGYVGLYRNEGWLKASARCEDGGQSASGGVLHLNKGDRVSIEADYPGASIRAYLTRFSGALLYVD